MYHSKQSKQSCAALLAAVMLGIAGCATAADSKVDEHAIVDFNSCAKPMYPHADVQAGHQGTVTLSFLVEQDGKVGDSKVVTSSGFATMDEAARTAIMKCRFRPATKNGKPVKDWTKVQYVWTLK
ncbi:energy transducer TonB [Massilia sp. YIM B02763]|uniref:energy transducer TonB n=1 Tax=Massilia sp. YIM B02763 TaxID=3050130 RepID=UPI0025B6500C|nr:energy transducer TonB [Massilia sp. YIM B02763]MDN4051859.1 energy transducer TonB [Massilia sp. YIM B02763]